MTLKNGQRLRIVRRSDRLADVYVFDAGQRDDFADARTFCQLALQTFENVKLFHSGFLDRAFVAGDHNLLVADYLAGKYSPNRQSPHVFVVIDIRHQQLQRIVAQRFRRGNRLNDLIEQGLQIL